MPNGPMPEGTAALSTAERQTRFRARRRTPQPPLIKRPTAAARRSRSRRWNDALAEMFAVQTKCAAWFDALPESPRDSATAEALQEMIDLNLEGMGAVQPPRG